MKINGYVPKRKQNVHVLGYGDDEAPQVMYNVQFCRRSSLKNLEISSNIDRVIRATYLYSLDIDPSP